MQLAKKTNGLSLKNRDLYKKLERPYFQLLIEEGAAYLLPTINLISILHHD